MRFAGIPRLAVGLLLAVTACESDLSNAVFEADEVFLDAVPRRELLVLAPGTRSAALVAREDSAFSGGLETATAALGPGTAELYRLTRGVTWSIDHQIFGTLRAVEAVVARPPTTRTENTRTWGPFREALSPVEVRFVMARDADARVTYAFEQRVPGGAFRAAVRGAFTPDAGAEPEGGRDETVSADTLEGAGEIEFDLTAFGGQGRVAVDFDRHAGGVDFTLELEAFPEGGPAEAPGDARYVARRGEDGAGELTFTALREDGQRWAMKSRWTADGAGRADARITAGAGGDGVVTECWDTDFERVYAAGDVETGDLAECAFREASLPAADFSKSAFGFRAPDVSK